MARVRRAPAEAVEGVPVELGDQLDPFWSDAEALAAHPVLGQYVDDATRARLLMGGRVYHHVAGRWARDNGLSKDQPGGHVDWRAFREAVASVRRTP